VPDSKLSSKMRRIWWCLTGPLAFLPIHAAGTYDGGKGMPNQCLSDFAVSSYIPTVNTLLNTSRSISVENNGVDSPSGLLIVSQPNTPTQTTIQYAGDEAKRVSKRLEKNQISSITLSDEHGTIEGVLKAMESFPSIHLACHASQNMTSPLESSIHLHDGPLKLSEVMKKNLPNSDFAFLSACQTSTGDKNLPEEVVHLAAGMLTAGYRSVVGTLWSIVDKHGPDMAEFFYESLLDGAAKSNICGAGAAQALHSATQRFREENLNSRDGLLVWVPYIHVGV
jgi:CHAT domain-containing protein